MTSAPTAGHPLERLISEEGGPLASRLGYALGAVRCAATVEITFEHRNGPFVVWLRPADDDCRYYRKTARFRIGYSGALPDQSALGLLDALVRCLAAWEGSVSASVCREVFASSASTPATTFASADTREILAVRAGLKPASRHLLRRARAEELAARATGDGLHVRTTDAAAFATSCCGEGVAEQATTLVHVGRTVGCVEAAAAAEQAMVAACARGERVSDPQVRALGTALGYPVCCVEAFLPIRDLATAEIRFHALRRTAGNAAALLNNVDEGRALVSHSLCRYDCSPSLRSARALLAELERVDRDAATRLAGGLAGLVIMVRREGALRLVLRGERLDGAFAYDDVDVVGSGARIGAWRDALQRGDTLAVDPAYLRVLCDGSELHRLELPPDEVQIRLFA